VTGDDFGKVKLFRYPCVVEHAPFRTFSGHSSHVMNVRFLADQRRVVSVGGHDGAIFQWRVGKAESTSD
jgi:WD40 repeat protein